MVLNKVLFTSILLLMLLSNCNKNNNNIDKDYDLTISLIHTYKLSKNKYSYNGTDSDSLRRLLQHLSSYSADWARTNHSSSDSSPFQPRNILIKCSGNMNVNELFTSDRILDINYSGITKFDILVDTTLLHCIGSFHSFGVLVTDSCGRKVDYIWEKEWNSLRVLCTDDNVIYLFQNDTLFKGNYYDLQNHPPFGNEKITFTRKNLPVVVINATFNTTMKNIVNIANQFENAKQLYFQFGKNFDCTVTRPDIWADTAIVDSNLYYKTHPNLKRDINKAMIK